MRTKVFIIEDHILVREGLKRLITQSSVNEIVGEAANAKDAVEKLQNTRPDVVVSDLLMPGLSGTSAVSYLLDSLPDLRILVVSSRINAEELESLLELGINGFVSKEAASQHLVSAIAQISDGGSYLGPVSRKALSRN